MNKIKKSLYYSATLLLYLSYLAIFFGIYTINPEYLKTAIHILELFISLVLIVRFHPFQKSRLENYDQQLIFLSATILLTNLGFTNYLLTKLNGVKDILGSKDVFSSDEMWEGLLMSG
jgi:hypothetical protein